MKHHNPFRPAVLDALDQRGLTQAALAHRMRARETTVSRILHKSGNPTLKSMASVARALKLNLKIVLE